MIAPLTPLPPPGQALPASQALQQLFSSVAAEISSSKGVQGPLAGLLSQQALAEGGPEAVVVVVGPGSAPAESAAARSAELAGAAASSVRLPNAVHTVRSLYCSMVLPLRLPVLALTHAKLPQHVHPPSPTYTHRAMRTLCLQHCARPHAAVA